MANHVMTFEQYCNRQIDESVVGDFARKVGDKISDVGGNILNSIDTPAVVGYIEKNIKLYINQGMKQMKDFDKNAWVDAFNEAQDVNWKMKKMDEGLRKYADYLWNRGYTSATSGGGGAYGVNNKPTTATGKKITVEDL